MLLAFFLPYSLEGSWHFEVRGSERRWLNDLGVRLGILHAETRHQQMMPELEYFQSEKSLGKTLSPEDSQEPRVSRVPV